MNVVLAVVLSGLAVAYALAWRAAWRRTPRAASTQVSVARLAAFVLGLGALWAAVGSPLSQLDRGHLTGHMLQHLLIMMVAAPLLLLGDAERLFRLAFRNVLPTSYRRTPNLVLCWLAGTLVVLFWHIPPVFAFGMRFHALQHVTFLLAGLLFWLPVVRPWPFRLTVSPWALPAYLFLATLPCDGLSAFLAFCGRVVYAHYDSTHGACHLSALDDQQRAGALMWAWVTIGYLVPAAVITVQLLSRKTNRQSLPEPSSEYRV